MNPADCSCRGVQLGCRRCADDQPAATAAAPRAWPRVTLNRPGNPAGQDRGKDDDRTFVRLDSGSSGWFPTDQVQTA